MVEIVQSEKEKEACEILYRAGKPKAVKTDNPARTVPRVEEEEYLDWLAMCSMGY